MTHICKAKALWSFSPSQPADLGFATGDILLVTRKLDGGWWEGQHQGKIGIFPSNYVQELPPDTALRPPPIAPRPNVSPQRPKAPDSAMELPPASYQPYAPPLPSRSSQHRPAPAPPPPATAHPTAPSANTSAAPPALPALPPRTYQQQPAPPPASVVSPAVPAPTAYPPSIPLAVGTAAYPPHAYPAMQPSTSPRYDGSYDPTNVNGIDPRSGMPVAQRVGVENRPATAFEQFHREQAQKKAQEKEDEKVKQKSLVAKRVGPAPPSTSAGAQEQLGVIPAQRVSLEDEEVKPLPPQTPFAETRVVMPLPYPPNPAAKKVRCMILGDSGVGKTALCYMLLTGQFYAQLAPNTGPLVFNSLVMIDSGRSAVELELIDMPGAFDPFITARAPWWELCNVYIFCFDYCNRTTMEHLEKQWVEEFRATGSAVKPLFLVACKKDALQPYTKYNMHQVRHAEGLDLAQRLDAQRFFETTATVPEPQLSEMLEKIAKTGTMPVSMAKPQHRQERPKTERQKAGKVGAFESMKNNVKYGFK